MPLSQKTCTPCRGGVPPLENARAQRLLAKLSKHWKLNDAGTRLKASYEFKNFAQAQAFCIAVGELAEQENHHPDLHYGWGYVIIDLWTHKIDGLHENDFILASKIDLVKR